MRNLKLLYSRKTALNNSKVNLINLSTESIGTVFFASDNDLFSYDWQSGQTNIIAALENKKIVGLEYISLNNELCVIKEDGEAKIYHLDRLSIDAIDSAFEICPGGIKAVSWSHDQEVIAVVTHDYKLIVMNIVYEPIAETNLLDAHFGEGEFINVGWGKKETQFHGTEGKAAAHKKPAEIPVENVNELDQDVSIVWRGDDELFAVSYVTNIGRTFKVFDKEGVLKFTSEKCAGLGAPIAWRPSGSWIAIPHILPNKYTVALFEKNGLRHREIVLPFKYDEEKVLKLLWSSDSEILAIYTECETVSTVYLYTICNYHWYQKQTLKFDGKLSTLMWDGNHSEGKTLHIVDENQRYSVYRWDYTGTRSTGFTSDDQAIVGVVDKSEVKLTCFRLAVVPPPMCSLAVLHSMQINHVSFLTKPSEAAYSNRFLTVDSANNISTFECVFKCLPERKIIENVLRLNTYSLSIASTLPLFYHHWTWLNDRQIVFCHNEEPNTIVVLGEFDNENNEIQIVHQIEIDGIVGNIAACNSSNQIICHSFDGKFVSIEIVEANQNCSRDDSNSVFQSPNHLFDLNCFCDRMECTEIDGQLKVVSLTTQQNFYINDHKIASDVTSFQLTDKFILFTTLDRLNFIRLDESGNKIINERRLERGSRLVTTVARDSRVIFQLPRGNLEALQPRVLSLCIIGELLDAHSYHKAFDLLRKQRINLNLLVDHNPSDFLEHISEFIADINNMHWLNLFLSDLQNEDVTVTMYSSNYQHIKNRTSGQESVFQINDKIDAVCEQCCQVFSQDSTSAYLLPMITAHVKRRRYEAALELIRAVKIAESKGTIIAVSSQEALKYLLYLVNVNDLYDVALGLYDFDLVLFVAQKSQKDPKEYLPFLNELKQLEENYRKYRIDSYLKRYAKALDHIVKCGVEKLDECKELIEKHNLFTRALRLFKPTEECYNDIVLLYADHLRAHGLVYEASLMYERAGDFNQACLSAKHTLDWKKVMRLAMKCNHPKEEIEKICRSLIPALQENGKHRHAADIIKFFNPKESDQIIKILCDGRLYDDAVFESQLIYEPRTEFICRHLTEFSRQTIEKLQSDHQQFNAYVLRLKSIRQTKAEKLLNGNDDEDVGDCDLFSDTTSMNSSRFTVSSRGSGKSSRSSKNRRKHERKLMSLKEGNPFEDIALVDAIYTAVHKAFTQQETIRNLLKSLIDLELDDVGVELQTEFDSFLNDIQHSLDVVWIPDMMISGEIKFDDVLDYAKVQSDQHYALIKPHQRAKPLLNLIEWRFEIIK